MIMINNFTLRLHVGNELKEITHAELESFAKLIGLQSIVRNRFSWILVGDIYINQMINGIDPYHIIDEIKALEGLRESLTKPPVQFRNPPLYPLWHKHYFSAHFIAANIYNELNRNNLLSRVVNRIIDPAVSPVFTMEMINDLSNAVVEKPFDTRSKDKRITGEWIVYGKHSGKNIYLCMAKHDSGDQEIFNKLSFYCRNHFPELEPFASAT